MQIVERIIVKTTRFGAVTMFNELHTPQNTHGSDWILLACANGRENECLAEVSESWLRESVPESHHSADHEPCAYKC